MTVVEACPSCRAHGNLVGQVGPYRVLRCPNCSLAWVMRVDLKQQGEAADYQDYGYNHNIQRHFAAMRERYQRGLRDRLARASLTDLTNRRFLDVGCANGEYLRTALDLGFHQASGIEIDESARSRAQVHGPVALSAAEFRGEKFDVIQIKNVLSNIEDPGAFLAAQLDLLSDDGVLIVDVLNQDSLTASLRGLVSSVRGARGRFGPLRPPYVINGFTTRSLSLMLERHGLRVGHLSTSYMGSDMVPYGPSFVATNLGRLGTFLGKGSMLISESRRA
jgi:SAM-dependent methyltransferase